MHSPPFLTASLYVALGGGIGSWLRFLVGRFYVQAIGPLKAGAFPWGTLTVNVVGSFAMGVLVGWLARHGTGSGLASEGSRLFLAVGLLGGFTTFSAFSLEVVNIFERGQSALAFAYIALSLLAGLAALAGGLTIMRAVG
jgi:CrcB protein